MGMSAPENKISRDELVCKKSRLSEIRGRNWGSNGQLLPTVNRGSTFDLMRPQSRLLCLWAGNYHEDKGVASFLKSDGTSRKPKPLRVFYS